MTVSSSSNHMNFPRTIGTQVRAGSHFLLLTSFESKNALTSRQTPNPSGQGLVDAPAMSSIALYIPPNSLKTQHSANYEGMEGGALRAGATTGTENLLANFNTNWWGGSEEGGEGVWASGGRIIQGLLGGATKMAAGGFDKATGMLSAGSGLAVNNHLALVYKGPSQFRTHDFVFNFWIKNKEDADEVQKIIKDLENGMLPRMAGLKTNERKLSAAFFQSPRHWTLKFCRGGDTANVNPYLFQIGKSVIKELSINHDQQSMVSLSKDGAPIQTTVNITFQEIELRISDDNADELQKERDSILKQGANAAQLQENINQLDFPGASNPGDRSGG